MAEFDLTTPEGIRDYALNRFEQAGRAKYDAGQKEHGGLITDRKLMDELEAEIIDMWFYLQATKIKQQQLVERLESMDEQMMELVLGKECRSDHSATKQ